MPFNVLETITEEERLNFSQSFDVKRPGILGTIFPDTKTQYLKAEYYRLMAGQRLPEVAFVHALDTEAEIGSRPGFEKVLTEKLFIKRKINQSERLQQAIENGVPDDNNLKKFVFDDAANLFEGVVARANVMKGQFLSTGIVKIKENHVDMSIDYGVTSDAKVTLTDWSKPDADIMGDIQKMVAIAEDNGYVVNKALTSLKMINYMRNNTAMQTAVLGAANKRLLTKQELANLLMQEYGFTIDRCDEKYRYRKADGTLKTGRYFKEDVFTLYEANANGSFGSGLWGVTPEELEYRQFIQEENRSFVTLSMWATPDPVAVWTKASGMFVPVAPKANGGIVIGTKAGE
nr:MAG TPA: major capsid protein [Caudoviricetes sp.]DAT53002.1 MAG TPA: major capsid protein [Caudoviricetes sp.]